MKHVVANGHRLLKHSSGAEDLVMGTEGIQSNVVDGSASSASVVAAC
jgi:hypothetical protein